MPTQVLMPQLGESVDEATIARWLKARGDTVSEMEPLVEITTDKVDTELPCPASGVLLDILRPAGATVKAGEVLALIGVPGEAKAEPGRALGFISPVVAKIASEHGVNLADVPGTGLGGRITKQDVMAFLQGVQPTQAELPDLRAEPGGELTAPHDQPAGLGAISTDDVLIPLTPVRRSIAEHMLVSRRTSPHVTTFMEADLSRVAAHRQVSKEEFARAGVRLTFTAYFVAAAVAALQAFPLVNSSWSDRGVIIHRQIHIGIATSLGEEGLIVPVIKNADTLSLIGLARTIQDLAERARAKKLRPEEVKGGTLTITNHGVTGSLFATPIINQPQCAILGVGAIQKRPVVISDEKLGDAIAIRPMAYISLTFDHRILDGAMADHYLGKLKQAIESWP